MHTVSVDAFYMDAHEVTNLEYHQFILENPQWQKGQIAAEFHDGNYLKNWDGNDYPSWKAHHPVTWVSWYAAMAYLEWENKRLPTGAEWECAARGGIAGAKYPWHGGISKEVANYNNNLMDTALVGRYPANQYGLSDICGNVWKWCLDENDAGFYSISEHRNPFSSPRPLESVIANFAEVQTPRVLRAVPEAAQHRACVSPIASEMSLPARTPTGISLCETCRPVTNHNCRKLLN